MRGVRLGVAIALVVGALVVAGCGGPEEPTQTLAREAVQSSLDGNAGYDTGEVHCTRNPRPWLVERQATVVICAARRAVGGCDWFRVDLVPQVDRVSTKVRLDAPNAGCVLP